MQIFSVFYFFFLFVISGNQGDASASPQLLNFAFQSFFPLLVSLPRAPAGTPAENPARPRLLLSFPSRNSQSLAAVCFRQCVSGPLKQPRSESRELQQGIRAAAAPRNVSSPDSETSVFCAVASAPASHQTHSSTLEPLFRSAASGSQSNQTDEQSRNRRTTTKT